MLVRLTIARTVTLKLKSQATERGGLLGHHLPKSKEFHTRKGEGINNDNAGPTEQSASNSSIVPGAAGRAKVADLQNRPWMIRWVPDLATLL